MLNKVKKIGLVLSFSSFYYYVLVTFFCQFFLTYLCFIFPFLEIYIIPSEDRMQGIQADPVGQLEQFLFN